MSGGARAGLRPGRVVPPTGFTAVLTLATAAAMAFLAVFAIALAQSAERLAARWSEALADTATVRIAAPADQMAAQTEAALAVLSTTPGIAGARALTAEETARLLEPWLGPGLPVDALPIPALIDVAVAPGGYDAEGLKLRLAAEAPGAVLDDHTRWRAPFVAAAERMRLLGIVSLVLIGGVTAAIITLAAQAALYANGQVIRVLRQIGARDSWIARAFVRRFTLRAAIGAAAGAAAGVAAVVLLPGAGGDAGFLTDLGFRGTGWLWPAALPPVAAVVAFLATRAAAFRTLKGVP